jgi:hypothetical protein
MFFLFSYLGGAKEVGKDDEVGAATTSLKSIEKKRILLLKFKGKM